MKSRVLLMLLLLLPTPAGAAADGDDPWLDRFALTGWLESVQSMRLRSPYDQLTSRVKMRGELKADLDWLYGFFSADAEKNWAIESETGLGLREAWLEHAGEGWDLRAGRQIIIWGKADGVQITDLVSPPDYTEAMTRDLDEIRLPVDAVRLRLLGRRLDVELIWIPVFRAAILPRDDNPWAVSSQTPPGARVTSAPAWKPATSLENSEAALKLSAYLSGLDLAASVFHTWDDLAAMHRTVVQEEDAVLIELRPRSHRLTVLGLEFSRPWSDFVFRGEAAYLLGKYHETTLATQDPLSKDVLKALFGTDWTPGDDWTVTAQLIGAWIIGHEPSLAEEPFSSLATLNISKKLLRQTLTLSNMLYWDLGEGECFDRAKAEYALNDNLTLSAGLDLFAGGDGQFGRYADNTQAWVRVKYAL